ncbi:MAG: glycosyltransferase family 9 protein [Fibrobacterota bacterium]
MLEKNRAFKFLDRLLDLCFLPLGPLARMRGAPDRAPQDGDAILFIKLCCFGDTLLAWPALHALKTKFPTSPLTVLASRRTAPLFERFPMVDEVVTLPLSGTGGLREFLRFPSALRVLLRLVRHGFPVLIDGDVHYRFLTPLGLFLGRRYRAGFDTLPGRARFYSHKAERPRSEPEWRSFFRLFAPLGLRPDLTLPIRLHANPAEIAAARNLLVAAPAGHLKVGIVAGASPNWPEKQWPAGHFSELMRRISDQRPATFFLIGTKEELTLARDLVNLYNRPGTTVNLAGKTPFALLAEVIRGLDLFISNDTGPMHLAALSGVPTLGIFGPTDERKWSPPGNFTALRSTLACRPCYYLSRMPACDHRRCLTDLRPETVVAAALKMAEGKSI